MNKCWGGGGGEGGFFHVDIQQLKKAGAQQLWIVIHLWHDLRHVISDFC